MNKEDIVNLYQMYRNSQKHSIDIEDKLLKASSEEDWIKQLSKKSTFLRSTLIEIEAMLNNSLYPLLQNNESLSGDTAIEMLNQVIEMSYMHEDDSVLVINVLKTLKNYFKKNELLSEEILATFYLALAYAERVFDDYFTLAYEAFDEVCSFKDLYCVIPDENVRKRILFAFYNRLINYKLDGDGNPIHLFELWNETKEFLSREDVRKIESDFISYDDYADMCKLCVQWSFICDCQPITDDILSLFYENLYPQFVTEDNLSEHSAVDAFSFIWYRYNSNYIDCNQSVTLLYKYYCDNNKNIDYNSSEFYTQNEVYSQCIFFMEQCFKFLAKDDCTLANKIEICNVLIEDYKKIYKSIPYLLNNTYKNVDLVEILHYLLMNIDDEDEALIYIREVIVRRNIMTLIHSTMLGKITEQIVHCMVTDTPELFFGLLKTNSIEDVIENEDYLIDYIVKAAYLHDIGKIRISDIINLQIRKLSESDFDLIKCHPTLGASVIKDTFLEDKYLDLILGHHKSYDGTVGYPKNFDNTKSNKKILIDILTIGDCIEAATDTLGRNYTLGKMFVPTVMNELIKDNNHFYNKTIVNAILNNEDVCNEIQYITGLGRAKIYYDIYQTYLNSY